MDLTTVLEDCLQRLASGESVADCLARYPERSADLAPMLVTAEHLHALSQARLTQGQRLRAKVALREELAAQVARQLRGRGPVDLVGWARARAVSLAAMVAVLFFVSVTFSAVASSRPGDLVYPFRVVMERAPAWLTFDAAGRAAAELAVADRRLSDIAGDGLRHTVAVNALLRSDRAAVQRALGLSDTERAEVARHVAAHANELNELASQAADPLIEGRLRAAAEQMASLASQITPLVTLPANTPTSAVTAAPTRRSTTHPPAVILTATPLPVTVTPPTAPVVEPIPSVGTRTVVVIATPRPRPRMSVTPPTGLTWTPIVPRPGTGTPGGPAMTPRPRPTLAVTPGWPQFTPVVTVPAPTVVVIVPPTIMITILPTFVIPSPVIPTGTPGQASVNTATPMPNYTWPAPVVTPPTVTTSIVRPANQYTPTATMLWITFTPAPTGTPRPGIRLTLTAMAIVSPSQTQTAIPDVTPTVRRSRATDAGVELATPTIDVQPTLITDVTPTPPQRPR